MKHLEISCRLQMRFVGKSGIYSIYLALLLLPQVNMKEISHNWIYDTTDVIPANWKYYEPSLYEISFDHFNTDNYTAQSTPNVKSQRKESKDVNMSR